MNIHGQTNLTTAKQLQIQDFLKIKKIDILHLQEIEIDEDTFGDCDFISSNLSYPTTVSTSMVQLLLSGMIYSLEMLTVTQQVELLCSTS